MFPLSMAAQNYPGMQSQQQMPGQVPGQMPGQAPGMQQGGQPQSVGGVSPLVKAMLAQKMGAAGGAAQAGPMGGMAQAANPVSGALMAQRLGLMK